MAFKQYHPQWGWNAILVVVTFILVFAVGCQSGGDQPQEGDEVEPAAEPAEQAQPQDAAVSDAEDNEDSTGSAESDPAPAAAEEVPLSPEEGWALSAHSNSYVLDENGRNDSCARCHSAAEWLPGPDDIPENCLTCKFDVDEPPPLIAEADWGHVSCKVCHRMDGDEPEEGYAWLDIAVIEEYIDVDSTTELCRKCHEQEDIPGHKPSVILGTEHGELSCTNCHDSHDNTVGCVNSNCHQDAAADTQDHSGITTEHSAVSCWACHDAAGLDVGPYMDGDVWVTFITAAPDGEEKLLRHSSHSYQAEVDCAKCHFEANPWDLKVDIDSGS